MKESPLASCQIIPQQVSIAIEGGVHIDGLRPRCGCPDAGADPHEALSRRGRSRKRAAPHALFGAPLEMTTGRWEAR